MWVETEGPDKHLRSVQLLIAVEAPPLSALADLLVEVYVRIDDVIVRGAVAIPSRL